MADTEVCRVCCGDGVIYRMVSRGNDEYSTHYTETQERCPVCSGVGQTGLHWQGKPITIPPGDHMQKAIDAIEAYFNRKTLN
jgi:RNA polymerase subunit RPABC4/transcription elongation factor Spt4